MSTASERHAVVVSPNPASRSGGVERFCWIISDLLAELGWTVTVEGPGTAVTGKWLRRTGRTLEQLRVQSEERVVALKPDLVISNGHLGGNFDAAHIHVYHGTLPPHAWAGRRAVPYRVVAQQAIGGGLAERRAGKHADTVVAVSRAAARESRRFLGVRVDQVIPNAVDGRIFCPGDKQDARERLSLPKEAKIALFVGRPESRKGDDLLTAAMAAGFELAVAGPAVPVAKFNLGVLSPHEVADAYRAADCVLFPTRYEGCSFVVLEALSVGVPLVTTAVGWAHDLEKVAPWYPTFVEPEFASVVAGLRSVYEQPEVCDLAARKLRAIVAGRGLPGFSDEWRQVIERTAGKA